MPVSILPHVYKSKTIQSGSYGNGIIAIFLNKILIETLGE